MFQADEIVVCIDNKNAEKFINIGQIYIVQFFFKDFKDGIDALRLKNPSILFTADKFISLIQYRRLKIEKICKKVIN